MDKPYFQKPVVAVSDPHSYVPYSELEDTQSSVNDSQRSGKCSGCSVYTVLPNGLGAVALARGSKTTDGWDYLSSGANTEPAYASVGITQRDVNDPIPKEITLSAHSSGTDTLNPPVGPIAIGAQDSEFLGFAKITESLQIGNNKGIFINEDGDMVLPSDGAYNHSIGWGAFRHNLNNSTVAFVPVIERAGFYYFDARPTTSFQPNVGKIQNIAGGVPIDGIAGDKMSLWIASDLAGIVTLANVVTTVIREEDTTIY